MTTLVELGAGDAPLSRRWVSDSSISSIWIADRHLHIEEVEDLEKDNPTRVNIIKQSVDFTEKNLWPENSLLVISASFHHIPKEEREEVLSKYQNENLLICEPLSFNIQSFLFALLTFVPAVLYPFSSQNFVSRLGAILWCWLIPIIPLMLTWDGLISAYRQWPKKNWLKALERNNSTKDGYKTNSIFQSISFIQKR